MSRVWQLLVRADGDTKAAQREIRALQKSTRNFGRGVRNLGVGLTAAVTLPVLAMARVGISELSQMQTVNAQTFAALKSTGKAAGLSAGQIQLMATNLSKLSGIDDQVVQSGANILLTFNKISGKNGTFARATKAALDLSVAFGKDMPSASVMVGKALQDPIKGVTALTRVGVTFMKQQKEQIKALVESGKTAQAQKLILKELETQVGGSAKAYGQTAAGAVGKLREQFAGIAAQMITNLLPAFQWLSKYLQQGMNWFEGLSDKTKKYVGIGTLLAAVLGPVLIGLGAMITASAALIPVIAGVSASAALLVAGIVAVIGVLTTAYATNEDFRKIVNAVGGALRTVAVTIAPMLAKALVNVAGQVVSLIGLISRLVLAITGGLVSAFNWVRANAASAWIAVVIQIDRVRDFAVALAGVLAGAVRTAFQWVQSNGAAAFSSVDNAIDRARDFATALANVLAGAVRTGLNWVSANAAGAWSGFQSAVSSVKNVIDSIVSGIDRIKSGLSSVASKISSLPSLPSFKYPKFARGGITSGPSIAGEAGPEAVIPMGRSAQNARDRMRVMREAGLTSVTSGTTLNVTVNGGTDVEALVRKLMFELGGSRLRMGGGI